MESENGAVSSSIAALLRQIIPVTDYCFSIALSSGWSHIPKFLWLVLLFLREDVHLLSPSAGEWRLQNQVIAIQVNIHLLVESEAGLSVIHPASVLICSRHRKVIFELFLTCGRVVESREIESKVFQGHLGLSILSLRHEHWQLLHSQKGILLRACIDWYLLCLNLLFPSMMVSERVALPWLVILMFLSLWDIK